MRLIIKDHNLEISYREINSKIIVNVKRIIINSVLRRRITSVALLSG